MGPLGNLITRKRDRGRFLVQADELSTLYLHDRVESCGRTRKIENYVNYSTGGQAFREPLSFLLCCSITHPFSLPFLSRMSTLTYMCVPYGALRVYNSTVGRRHRYVPFYKIMLKATRGCAYHSIACTQGQGSARHFSFK